MISLSVYLLFFMSFILHGDGLHKLYAGTSGGKQVTRAVLRYYKIVRIHLILMRMN